MTLARWQTTIVDEAGNVQSGASIEVRREVAGAPLAVLYSDREGATPLGNPFTTGSDGFAAFHVAGGAYRVTAAKGGFTRVWRYVAIGTTAEFDAELVPDLVQQVDAGYALRFENEISAPPSPGAIRFNNANLSAATEAYVSVENLAGSAILDRLLELFDAARGVKDAIILSDPANGHQTSFQITGVDADGSPATYVTITLAAHNGATSFTDGERINLQRERAGADGEISGPGAVTAEGQIAIFSDSSGNNIEGAVVGSPPNPLTIDLLLTLGGFPSGTLMLFQQTNAPPGWTKQTTHNDKALRVVSSAASSGGTTAFTTVFASRTPAGTVGDTTLTIDQMPLHGHPFRTSSNASGNNQGGLIASSTGPTNRAAFTGTPANTIGQQIGGEGGGGSHTHTWTGNAMDFAVAYVDLIIASKD
jgi:hypothetical protein